MGPTSQKFRELVLTEEIGRQCRRAREGRAASLLARGRNVESNKTSLHQTRRVNGPRGETLRSSMWIASRLGADHWSTFIAGALATARA